MTVGNSPLEIQIYTGKGRRVIGYDGAETIKSLDQIVGAVHMAEKTSSESSEVVAYQCRLVAPLV